MEPMVEFIKKENPDILALQEVYDSSDLSLEYPYIHHAPEFLHINGTERHVMGNAVFSEFPITASDVVFYDKPFGEAYESKRETYKDFPRNLQHVEIDADGTILNVFNTHGVWGEDGGDNEARLAMSAKIIGAVNSKENVTSSAIWSIFSRANERRASICAAKTLPATPHRS